MNFLQNFFSTCLSCKDLFREVKNYRSCIENTRHKSKISRSDTYEYVKTIVPIETFLFNNKNFSHVYIYEKNSAEDKLGIDCLFFHKDGKRKTAQITLADEKDKFEQASFWSQLLRNGKFFLLNKVFTNKKSAIAHLNSEKKGSSKEDIEEQWHCLKHKLQSPAAVFSVF